MIASPLFLFSFLFFFVVMAFISFESFLTVITIFQVLNMVNDQYYLYRMNALDALLKLAPVMGSEITCSQFLPVILAASKDRLTIKFLMLQCYSIFIPAYSKF